MTLYSWICSIFTQLWNYHHYLTLQHSVSQNRICSLITVEIIVLQQLPSKWLILCINQKWSLIFLISSAVLFNYQFTFFLCRFNREISYKWNNKYEVIHGYFASLKEMFYCFPYCRMWQYYIFIQLNYILLRICLYSNLLIHQSANGHLYCSQHWKFCEWCCYDPTWSSFCFNTILLTSY